MPTAQFGKNHLGDRDEMLPTMHGFDEFYGTLYHLNAEEEPELRDYLPAKDRPNFRKMWYIDRVPLGARTGFRRKVPGDLQGIHPRQKATSFTIDQVLEMLQHPHHGSN
jgi:arylsulfatase A-like enzyme